jgi:hypothetical protein
MTTTRTQPGNRVFQTGEPGRRRSMRVLLSLPILVTGKNSRNEDFQEETRTLVVNAHGALIALGAPVTAGQEITIHNQATRDSRICRVAHVGNVNAGKIQLGIEFLQPAPVFWQVDFPPEDWVIPES